MTDHTPFDQWVHDLHAICGAYDGVPQRGQRQVRGRIAVHAFDALDVADVSGDVAGIERDRRGIRRDEAEHIFFLIGVSGTFGITHFGQDTRLGPGDCLLLDSTREGRLSPQGGAARLLSVHLPRQSFLAERRPGLRIGHRLAAEATGARDLTRHFFRAFRPRGGRGARAALLHDLIHHAFCGQSDGVPDLTDDAGRWHLALDLIDAHLGLEDLSLAWLARRLGRSERSVQRLFEAQGTSFVDLVRAKRYRFVTEHLARLPQAHGHLADLAFRAGFRDLSNFNRGFRARYGVSPRGWHRAQGPGSRHAAPALA
jgi:AraC-like DNA-binding protein